MSNKAIEGLKPELLWQHFYELSQIPRPSKREEKAVEFVREFARKNNFEFKEDKVGNVVIKVPATKGKEKSPTIVLQGHVDMVCEKNKGTKHDFDKDPIKLINTGKWLTADGTTLGADNGIGVAAAMAIALDKTSVHGPLEILCTIDEETGMTGVKELQSKFISGNTLLNMDSEEDGAFYIGCSGGQDTAGKFKVDFTRAKKNDDAFEILVTGLRGGHSGLDIHEQRGNAIKLLAQLLNRIDVPFQISHISGGSLRNAIPREAEAVIFVKDINVNKVKKSIKQFVTDSLNELKTVDGGLEVKIKKSKPKNSKVIKKDQAEVLVNTLLALPHGVVSMSPDIPNLVETSTNLATLKMEGKEIIIGTSQRSSIESAKDNIANMVKSIFKLANSEITEGDGYPGWQPNIDSNLLKVSQKVYKRIFKKEPEIKAIHAGLETGLLGAKYPGLDMISFGPTIQGAHSPTEKVNIKDVEKFYTLLKGILKELS
ncbi:MAG: aminoacyl-histidine dipeptidase [Ignavibacteriales bacterium]|nr:aminoacyl-histidine dipeptidase [Ignavibacteriales bacterium]MCB9211327.1 aminoacyl-histidine dipeptidase [Ignavibacteriales bacterium]MCB9218719.1 aminoacyl-histidine dipeptidase [Ignavibacteriales bacterium]MCB9259275.1 aminoacyl-histidine dipeptidase [Ignavibacteriales bacterium]